MSNYHQFHTEQAVERWRQASLIYGIRYPGQMETRYELSAAGWHGRQLNAFEDGWDAAMEFLMSKGILDMSMIDMDSAERSRAQARRKARLEGKVKYKLIEEVVDDSIQER